MLETNAAETSDVAIALLRTLVVLTLVVGLQPLVAAFRSKVSKEHLARAPRGGIVAIATAVHAILEPPRFRFHAGEGLLHLLAPLLALAPALASLVLTPAIPQDTVDVGVFGLLVPPLLSTAAIGIAAFASSRRLALISALHVLNVRLATHAVFALAVSSACMWMHSLSLVQAMKWQHAQAIFSRVPALGLFLFPVSFVIALLALVMRSQALQPLPPQTSVLDPWFAGSSKGSVVAFRVFGNIELLASAALMVVVFFGGSGVWFPEGTTAILVFEFAVKTTLLVFVLFFLEARVPRLSYSRVLRICWLVFMPAVLLNLAVVAWSNA